MPYFILTPFFPNKSNFVGSYLLDQAKEINKQIDAALAAGKITADQATAQKAKSVERVTNMVNNVRGFGKKANRPGVLPKPTSASSTSFKTA